MEELHLPYGGYNLVFIETLFRFSELLLGIITETYYKDSELKEQEDTILNSINSIVTRSGYQIVDIGNKDAKRLVIIEKDPLLMDIVEKTGITEMTIQLFMYAHERKGNLEGKRKTLTALSSSIEPIISDRSLETEETKKVFSDIGFLLNCFNIRHNNTEGPNRQDYIETISDEELEKWYDFTYKLILIVIAMKEQAAGFKGLQDIKKNYNWHN